MKMQNILGLIMATIVAVIGIIIDHPIGWVLAPIGGFFAGHFAYQLYQDMNDN